MQKIKIKEISVSNFKGIDSLNFSPKEINIIVGPNNTGKSSLLNAISLIFYSLNGFNNESKELFDESILYPLDHQIYENNKNIAKINLKLLDMRGKIVLPFEMKAVYGKDFPRGQFNHKAFTVSIENQVKWVVNKQLRDIREIERDQEYSKGSYIKRRAELERRVYPELYQGCLNTLYFQLKYKNDIISESYIENLKDKWRFSGYYQEDYTFRTFFKDNKNLNMLKNRYGFNFIFRSQLKKFDLIQYFKKLSQTPNFYNVLDKLRAKLYYLYDIREIEGRINIVTIGSDNSKIFVPFELMGDGFQSILITTILFELMPKGIVLLEEPENCLHPGYMDILIDVILQKSEDYQYFFSTHSLDFIKILIEKAKKTDNLEKILLLRLNRRNNKIDREILLKNEILEELEEIKVDLRGY